MKRLLMVLALASLPALAQTKISPDCDIQFTFTGTGHSSQTGCAQNLQGVRNWTLTYQAIGFTALTLTVQEAPDNGGIPGAFSTFTAATGTNPATSTTGVGADATFTGYAPWVQVELSGLMGSGTVTGHLYGCRNPGCGASASSGGGGAPGGSVNDIQWKLNATTFGGGRCTMDSSQNIVCAGSFTSGSGSGATGAVDLVGKTSGATSTITVDDTNTATVVKLPNDATSGLYVPTSPTATPSAGCAQFSGTSTEVTSTATPCGSGGGGGTPGSTYFTYVNSTGTGPNDTASETSLIGTATTGSKTIPANTFTAGALTELRVDGQITTPASPDNLTLNIYMGATKIATGTITGSNLNSLTTQTFKLSLTMGTLTGGASCSMVIEDISIISGAVLAGDIAKLQGTGTTFNCTATQAFDVKAQWGAAQVGESLLGMVVGLYTPGAGASSGGLSVCTAAGGSGTAYTCTTNPTFVPATGDVIAFFSDVESGATPTLNVNSSAADGLFKNGGQIAIGGGDLCAAAWNLAVFDASNHWEITSSLCTPLPPAIGSWTQRVFSAGSAANTTFGYLFLQTPQAGGAPGGYALLSTPQPSTPYTIDMTIAMTYGHASATLLVGWLESSTQKTTQLGPNGSGAYSCSNLTAFTTFASNGCGTSGATGSNSALNRIQYIRLQDTGTVLRVFLSADGVNFQQYGADVNVNSFFTTAPDSIIFGGYGGGASNLFTGFSLLSYYVH